MSASGKSTNQTRNSHQRGSQRRRLMLNVINKLDMMNSAMKNSQENVDNVPTNEVDFVSNDVETMVMIFTPEVDDGDG
ncbi:hypothetical protein M5689_001372 [Euphorbia peplus]|nr:hypothetical protein M5689_001372 [Euphorbia peplus]